MASTPMFVQWDDHEVLNNWWPGQVLPAGTAYRERDVNVLAARSKQAFFEYHPITEHPDRKIHRRISRGPLCELFFVDLRSHRAPNNPNRQTQRGKDTDMMGASQLAWLAEGLASSKAVWKFVCCDMPIGLVVRDTLGQEAFANGDGPPLGRELELAELFRTLRDRAVRNVVWLTADVHYCASHYYNPARARFTEFDPFWEFVSGPLNAGTFGPTELDPTFGPELRFCSRKAGDAASGPWTSNQFFGTVDIDPKTRACSVTHWNRDGEKLWSGNIPAA
jgi:alkaline phosphatase D